MPNPYRRMMRNCWSKGRFERVDASLTSTARRIARHERQTVYYYPCPFGEHYHLTKNPTWCGERLEVAAPWPPVPATAATLDKPQEPS